MEWIVEAESMLDVLNGRMVCFKHFVRCKDCKYGYTDEQTLICGYRGFFVSDSFFCADGKRKDDETN